MQSLNAVVVDRTQQSHLAEGQQRYKDEVLDDLANKANVAQFISFGPDLTQRYSRVHSFPPNQLFGSIKEAAATLLKFAPESSVNVRSFTPQQSKSREFIYGLKTIAEVESALRRLAGDGLYTILNETIDVNDGGISGVVVGDLMEFAPGDTPRCVEKPGVLSIRRQLGQQLLEKVYSFPLELDYGTEFRVEFSLHPLRRGFQWSHTIVWELEEVGSINIKPDTTWPNLFSRFIGDKAFGLLVADVLGLPVPATTVFARRLPPFNFGQPTETGEIWIRTCPTEQVPGKFTTHRGWIDPYKLLASEDPDATHISSVLAQEGVEAQYSGALAPALKGSPIVEGVRGYGDGFMQGSIGPENLPAEVIRSVYKLYDFAIQNLGPVRCEWVYDGKQAWVVQIHKGIPLTEGRTIYPGKPSVVHRFRTEEGIENLRRLISTIKGTNEGVVILGDVGLTSHLGDLLRKDRIPSWIEPQVEKISKPI